MKSPGTPETESKALRVGISSCLLGNEVRFDGGHKRDAFLTDLLSLFVEWVTVCPEVESGMTTPRPALQLFLGPTGDVGVRESRTGKDRSSQLQRLSQSRAREMRRLDLAGFVLKKDSPSCGMERVRQHSAKGEVQRNGSGIFAAALRTALPNLPIEEEGRLRDDRLRENFIERLFAYRRVRDLFEGQWRPGDIVRFHTAHKLQLLAHSTQAYRELGGLVAEVKSYPRAGFRDEYEASFMSALCKTATVGRTTNVLQHMAGYFRRSAPTADRSELADVITDYQSGLIPLIVPVTLLRHHSRVHNVEYLLGQTFLSPHPKELMLRNHV